MKKQTLAILVPTHTEHDLRKYLLSCRSLEEMNHLNKYAKTSIAICGQPPFHWYPYDTMKCNTYGIKVSIQMVPQENPARLTFLRQTSADLYPEADFYLILDHNAEMVYGSAGCYIQAMSFLNKYRTVGAIFCGSSRGAPEAAHGVPTIVRYEDKHNSTSRGIMVRNDLHGQLFPPATLSLAGSGDESVLALETNLRGLWVYKQWNNPTLHHPENPSDREKLEPGKTIKNNVHNWDVANANCFAWCRSRLGWAADVDMYGRAFINKQFKPLWYET